MDSSREQWSGSGSPPGASPELRGAVGVRGRRPAATLDLREVGAIFAGGAAGALARVWIARALPSPATSWPWAIFAINVSGSFLLAYIATRLQERLPLSTYRRPLIATGFCGAYTTFSTFQVEVLALLEAHRWALGACYALASITAGLLAIWLAVGLARSGGSLR